MSSSDPESAHRTLAGGSRQQGKAQTRERIAAAAHELFRSRGFADTTAQQVARLAGVSVGSVFQHASDKEDLLLLVLQAPLTSRVRDVLDRPASTDLLTDVTRLFAAWFEVFATMTRAASPAVRALWFGNGPNARAGQWAFETFLEDVTARIEAAQARGELAEGAEPRTLTGNLASLYQGVLLDWCRQDEDVEAAVTRLRAAFALQLIPLQTDPPDAP